MYYRNLQNLALRPGLEVEVPHRPGDSVEELSGSEGTEAVPGDLTTQQSLLGDVSLFIS